MSDTAVKSAPPFDWEWFIGVCEKQHPGEVQPGELRRRWRWRRKLIERIRQLEARLTALGQHPDADPGCSYCNGSGTRYWHNENCTNDDCGLGADIGDCIGQVEECACVEIARARGEGRQGE